MTDRPYAKAPITEAVIEIRFAAPVEESTLMKASGAFGRNYPTLQEFQQVQFQIGPGADGQVASSHTSTPGKQYRRSGNDEQEVLVMTPSSIIVSQLAPYCGWSLFFARFQRDWKAWVKEVGRPKITRIGMRFINRIDIPNGAEDIIMQQDYVRIGVSAPASFGPTVAYAVQAIFKMPSMTGNAVINTAILPFALVPGFTSVNVDIDLGFDANVPQSDVLIFDTLTRMRKDKNFMFEEIITDQTRKLIQ